VNPQASDLGRFSHDPPQAAEQRSCGTVVAFASDGDLFDAESLPVHEVLYRAWWYSGSRRCTFNLAAPEMEAGFASLPLAACDLSPADPSLAGGYVLTAVRVATDVTLTRSQVEGLFLAVDASGSTIQVSTSPAHPSLLLLNPPSDDELRRRDSDGDGANDWIELFERGSDPYRPDAPGADPLPRPLAEWAQPEMAVPALPEPERFIESDVLAGTVELGPGTVARAGNLRVEGDRKSVV
jgi:hypothetical protein